MPNNILISPQGKFTPISVKSLDTPVQFLTGVGPHRAELFAKLDIHTLEDLLLFFPREHQDRNIKPIQSVSVGQKMAIKGIVVTSTIRQIGPRLGQAKAMVKDRTGSIELIWFKRLSYKFDSFSALKRDLVPEAEYVFFGQVVWSQNKLALRVDQYEKEEEGEANTLHTNRIVPVYSLTEGMSERWLREFQARVVSQYASQLVDPIPESLRISQNLISFSEAVQMYHFPKNWIERDRARERLAFDELFFLELALEWNRTKRQEFQGYSCLPSRKFLTPFKHHLGYEFTQAQVRVIKEIFQDMAYSHPMNRLLQGDVGSGKTIVALSTALLAIENHLQVAFLAPTEILAEQHFLSMEKYFKEVGIKWGLLTRSTKSKARNQILSELSSGKLDLLIGTHAILNADVKFKSLGLVIIDEQHRFGVQQRARLVSKQSPKDSPERRPHVLIMTATPIPRTLALTLYGDLDVSVIDDPPKGRIPIHSQKLSEGEAMTAVELALERNEQVYVVLPLIEESDLLRERKLDLKAAKIEYEKFRLRFPHHNVGLLHGQLKNDEKQFIMKRLREGDISILVATPVIEVGIDVPNVTLILIMNPERFGLAQLHQLRGRVGRGPRPSTCILVKNQIDEIPDDRIQLFCSIADGFRLAEEDLKLRGPGEMLGDSQHGLPFFRVANLVKDALLISRVRQAANDLVEGHVAIRMPEFSLLNRYLYRRFGQKIHLSHVG